MNDLLTYRSERPKGFDPVNDPADLIFAALAAGFFILCAAYAVFCERLR